MCYGGKCKLEDMATVLEGKILLGPKAICMHQTDKQGINMQVHVHVVQTTLLQHSEVWKL